MAYLYLNFSEYLNESIVSKMKRKSELFSQSLNEQYETIKRTIRNAPNDFQAFIQSLFLAKSR